MLSSDSQCHILLQQVVEQAEWASKPTGKASDLDERASEPAVRVSELWERAWTM